MDNQKLFYLANTLLSEYLGKEGQKIPDDPQRQFTLYRSLVNIRPAGKASDEYLKIEDEFLKELIEEKGITDIADLVPEENGIYLWKGDITTLRCDAIVNAANSKMTGCWYPGHDCIDNCIHTFAGIRLRYECDKIMREQDHDEPTGQAKITSAYNLPSKYVIHTVGPIVRGPVYAMHCRQLESSYKNCLETAVQNDIKSIAFCCISTGVYGFPQKRAAEVAVKTVRKFLETHDINVIFNVFKEEDYEIYKELLLKDQ